ncbi:hypothetical protein A2U01_0047522 [Trifolium medium]|uniref:Uncharacterized protein n=1 Tax=Trifolium medium TaxID=97028 RepID=A0A392QQQ7_9FABA|nr:hypothetical protein [Trifolium medium]
MGEELARANEEKKKLEGEVSALKLAMAPAADEHEAAKGLVTRAELVKKIGSLARDVLEGAKYSFYNAVAQLKIVNAGVELTTEGIGMLRRVEDGQIIIPEEYKEMEIEEEEEEEEEHMEGEHHEEGHDDDDDGKEHQDENNGGDA